MAVSSSRVVAGATPTLLVSADADGLRVTLRNADATAAAEIGGAAVAVTNGYSLLAGAVVNLPLHPGEKVYGVSSSGLVSIHVLIVNGT